MKTRILSAILILCLIFSCVGCMEPIGNDSTDPSATSPTTPSTPSSPNNNNTKLPSAPAVDPDKVALKVNGIEIPAIVLNYIYLDTINEYINQYGQWISYILDVTKPLSQQYIGTDSNETWADHFLDTAIDSAKNTYALYAAAKEAGHTLTAFEQETMDGLSEDMYSYVKDYGYESVDAYLLAVYGEGASIESYMEYYNVVMMASSYYSAYAEKLQDSYTADILKEFEGEESYKYHSYTYYTHYLDAKSFSSTEALQEAAKTLSDSSNNTVDLLNAAIAELEKQSNATDSSNEYSKAVEYKNTLYSRINASLQEWLRDSARKAGDIGAFPYYTSDSSGNQTLNGYYVVLFQDVNDNRFPLVNVRHILVAFEGGSYDKTTGQTVYTEADKNKAKNEAMLIYNNWLNGEKTEESFAEMAKLYTDDGNGDVGGIYNNVYPGQMVQTFNDWCFDQSRKPGDHGLVETEYGYHVMFYSGDSETSFHDYMSSNDKLTKDMEAWQKALLEAAVLETIDTSAVNSHYVLYAG